MDKTAKHKLSEQRMSWKEKYTPKSSYLKRMYDSVVGSGSYFRFEGKSESGDEYYCILGPAKIKDPRAKWFAGIRKEPAKFAAGGKYFDSLDRAAVYAMETWGVKTPKELHPYTSAQLYGIKDKIEKWEDEHEQDEKDARHEEREYKKYLKDKDYAVDYDAKKD